MSFNYILAVLIPKKSGHATLSLYLFGPKRQKDTWMGFMHLLPLTPDVKIGKTFVFVHIDVSGCDVCVLKPDLRGNSFPEGFPVGFAG